MKSALIDVEYNLLYKADRELLNASYSIGKEINDIKARQSRKNLTTQTSPSNVSDVNSASIDNTSVDASKTISSPNVVNNTGALASSIVVGLGTAGAIHKGMSEVSSEKNNKDKKDNNDKKRNLDKKWVY